MENIQISISNLASILKVHQRTLRIWDEQGVLTPTRSDGNQRFYTTKEIKKAMLILFLARSVGVNLIAAKLILKLLDEIKPENYIKYLEKLLYDIGIDKSILEENLGKFKKRRKSAKITSALRL